MSTRRPNTPILPSYLVWATSGGGPFHALFAADVDRDNVRIVTAYRPNADEWKSDLKSRKEVLAKVEGLLSGVDASVELEIIPFAA